MAGSNVYIRELRLFDLQTGSDACKLGIYYVFDPLARVWNYDDVATTTGADFGGALSDWAAANGFTIV